MAFDSPLDPVACGRVAGTYQLTAFKPQPQLSQKQIVKITATHSLVRTLLLTHDTSGSLQGLFEMGL